MTDGGGARTLVSIQRSSIWGAGMKHRMTKTFAAAGMGLWLSAAAAAGQWAFLGDSVYGLPDLNDLLADPGGWNLLGAQAINTSGQIADYGSHHGVTRGFPLTGFEGCDMLTASAGLLEPGSMTLLGAGLVGLGWMRRRRWG
jgi:PEP-CTERM motif